MLKEDSYSLSIQLYLNNLLSITSIAISIIMSRPNLFWFYDYTEVFLAIYPKYLALDMPKNVKIEIVYLF